MSQEEGDAAVAGADESRQAVGPGGMRILILVHYYFPNIQSCAKVMHDLAVVFRDQGHEVVLAAPDEALKSRREISREEGITVVRVRSGRFRGVPLALRAWNEWRLSAVLWRHAGDFLRRNPCQLIVVYSPTIFFGPLVRRLKRLWRCRTYLVLRDIFPKWIVDAGVIRKGGLIYRVFRRFELLLYDAADIVGVMSERNREYFEEEGLADRYRLEVLRNWAPERGQEVAETRYRQELGLEGRGVFFYGGNLGVAQGAGAIVRLAAALEDEPRAFFLVVGDGSEAERLRQDAEATGLENLRFLDPVEPTTYLGMVSEFDVGLIVLNRHLETHNFPGKMLDYMYFGKPILAAVNPGNDLQDLLEEHGAGLVCINGEDDRMRDHALRLVRDAELRSRIGRESRRTLETEFSASKAARQILSHVSDR